MTILNQAKHAENEFHFPQLGVSAEEEAQIFEAALDKFGGAPIAWQVVDHRIAELRQARLHAVEQETRRPKLDAQDAARLAAVLAGSDLYLASVTAPGLVFRVCALDTATMDATLEGPMGSHFRKNIAPASLVAAGYALKRGAAMPVVSGTPQ